MVRMMLRLPILAVRVRLVGKHMLLRRQHGERLAGDSLCKEPVVQLPAMLGGNKRYGDRSAGKKSAPLIANIAAWIDWWTKIST